MRTAKLAEMAGVNAQTLRYYERRGLLARPPRGPSGYRSYPVDALQIVRFVKRAQDLGFSLSEVEELMRLRRVTPAQRNTVQALANAKIGDVSSKIVQLERIRSALEQLLTTCCGESAATCPILEALESHDDH